MYQWCGRREAEDKKMNKPLSVLIVEDSEDDALLLVRELTRGDYFPTFKRVDTSKAMQTALDKQKWEVVISDYTLMDFNAFDALHMMKSRGMDLPFIVVSGTVTDDAVVAAMKSGAHDYIQKGNLQRLVPAIERELKDAEVRKGRNRAEEALKKSETRYRNLVEDAAAGVALIDTEGRFVYLNNTLCQMMGYEGDEIFGKPFADFLHPDDKERAMSYLDQSFTQPGDKPKLEFRVVHKGGSVIHMYSSPTPLCYRDKIAGFSAIIVDITELRRAEERLRESEASLAEAQRIAHMGNWDWDIKNNTLRWSDEIYRVFSLEPQQFGATYEAFLNSVHPDDREFVQKSVNEALFENRPCSIEHRIILPDGSVRIVHEQGEVSFDENKKPIRMVGTVHDITERKRAEKKAQEAETLRELDRLRTELLANVSHELRTPLASIKGFVSTLLRTDTKWSEEEQRDFLQTADQEADRLTHLINDLLDMSRLDVGALKLKKRNHHISEILNSVSNRLARLAEGHKLKMTAPLELPMVYIDEMRICRVLTNLVENAAKYSPEGSEITVGTQLDGNKIVIEITDKGEGIPAEFLPKVFDRFYQTDRIASGQKSGTGLGLSICRGIIEAHGGRIWVESEVGAGSKFSFSLPLSTGEEQDD